MTEKPNPPRLFAYATGAFMLGAVVHMLSSVFLPYTQVPGGVGLLVMAAYGAIYLNLAWGLAKRYIRKTRILLWVPFALSALMIVPAIVQILLKEEFPDPTQRILYILLIFTGALIGSRIGIQNAISR